MGTQLWCDSDQDEWNSRYAPALTNQVVEFTLIISWTGGHFLLEFLHRQNLDTYVNEITYEECHVLDE
jgi:hypothetical protein